MSISYPEASLLALFLETLFYGVFLTLFLLTLFILRSKSGTQQRLLLPMATVLLCIATAHLVVGFVRSLEAFIFDVQTISAETYYVNLASPLEVAHMALYIAQTMIADGIMVWRCYVLNHRSLLVAITGCITLLSNGAIGCYIVWSFSNNPVGQFAVPSSVDVCITTFFTLTMVISVTCTSSIAWLVHRSPTFMSDGSISLFPIFIVIIETGALYTANVLALLIAFLIGSGGQFAALDTITPIVGIAFSLVILQVHFQVGGKSPTEQPAEPRVITFRRGDEDRWMIRPKTSDDLS